MKTNFLRFVLIIVVFSAFIDNHAQIHIYESDNPKYNLESPVNKEAVDGVQYVYTDSINTYSEIIDDMHYSYFPSFGSNYKFTDNVLYDNGPIVTHPGAGPGGLDASVLQESIGLTFFGWSASQSDDYSQADDFIVTDDGWTLTNINFYAFQSNANNLTITEVFVQIWNGDPRLPESSVVFGDLSTNRLNDVSWTNSFKVFESDLTNPSRRIQMVTADLNGCILTPGTYWAHFQFTGSTSYNGPFVPLISIWDQPVTGNGLKLHNDNWTILWSGNPPNVFQQGAPFIIEGFVTACPEPSELVTELISQTTARVQWTENGYSTNWEIEYGITGFTQGNGTILFCECDTICNYYYDLVGLLPGTSYDWYIRAKCDSSTYSDWSNPETFVTVNNFLNIKTFLEGPFFYGQMSPNLNSLGYIPLNQPYNTPPWNYQGNESVEDISDNSIIDWVLVDIIQQDIVYEDTSFIFLARKAAFIMNNGMIVDTGGSNLVELPGIGLDDCYLRIIHRNHLPIISSEFMTQSNDIYNYNFTTDAEKAMGGNRSQNELQDGIWGMMAGNGDHDGQIDNVDKDSIWFSQLFNIGYYGADFNMDCQVDYYDKITKWEHNCGKGFELEISSPEN